MTADLGKWGAPRAAWWRRLFACSVETRLDRRADRIALRARYPWATWRERTDLALAERDEKSHDSIQSTVGQIMADEIRSVLDERGRKIREARPVLEALAALVPEEREAIARLGPLLATGAEYEAREIADAIRPTSDEGLMLILLSLLKSGVLRYDVVAKSPSGEILGRYKHLSEVPTQFVGARGEIVRAGFDTIRVKYRSGP